MQRVICDLFVLVPTSIVVIVVRVVKSPVEIAMVKSGVIDRIVFWSSVIRFFFEIPPSANLTRQIGAGIETPINQFAVMPKLSAFAF